MKQSFKYTSASLFKNDHNIEEVIIPRTIEHESDEYLITSIAGTNTQIKSIYRYAFYNSEIEEIYFPTCLKKLKEGWCFHSKNFTIEWLIFIQR